MYLMTSIPDYKGWSLDLYSSSEDRNAADADFYVEMRHCKVRHLILRSSNYNNTFGPECVVDALEELMDKSQQVPKAHRDSFFEFITLFMLKMLEVAGKG